MAELRSPLLTGRHLVLAAASSFLRVSSVSRAPARIQGRRLSTKTLRNILSQLEATSETYPLSRPRGLQPCPGFPLGVLQLLLQVGHLPLRLARQGLFDALDLLRSPDLGLQICLVGCGGLCVCISRFP
jgi:hypothetical protein